MSESPKDGDKVLTCGHQSLVHVWKTDTMAHGPEGLIKIGWSLSCDACCKMAGGNAERIAWMECKTWKGDEPLEYNHN